MKFKPLYEHYEQLVPHTNHLISTELPSWHFPWEKQSRRQEAAKYQWIPLSHFQSHEIGTRIDSAMLREDNEVLMSFCREFE